MLDSLVVRTEDMVAPDGVRSGQVPASQQRAFPRDGHQGDGSGPASAAPSASVDEGVEYTCPMHPEIRRPGPGACPICGMALEPVIVSAESGPNAELVDMSRRFWVAVILTVPVLVLVMGSHFVPAIDHAIPDRLSNWLQLILTTPVVLWAGWPFFTRGWTSVRTMKLNMFTLVAMGTGVAWLYSVVGTVAPGRLRRGHCRHSSGLPTSGVYQPGEGPAGDF